MLKAIDVANFFIYLMQEEENELTNLKVNKLLFYAQGYFLKRFSKPLFSDQIQAWQYGPVVPNVYHAFKKYGKNSIGNLSKDFALSNYTEEEKELLVDVAREYGCFTGETLKNMTHKEGSPWSQVFALNERNAVISNDLIKDYFDRQEDIVLKDFDIPEDSVIGYHDKNGVLVLPEEYEY